MSGASSQFDDTAGETTKAGDPVSSCVKDPTPPPPQDRPCHHQKLTIQCSHGGRNITIDPQQYFPWLDTLEVVAGPDKAPDKIECLTTITEGPCSEHNNLVFDLYPLWNVGKAKPAILEMTSEKLVLEATSVPFETIDYITHFFPIRPKTRTYQIDTWTHDGRPLTGFVHVYPDLRWEVTGIEAGFEIKAGQPYTVEEVGFFKRAWNAIVGSDVDSDNRTFTISPPKLKWSHDGPQSHELSLEFQKELSTVCKWLDFAAMVVEFFLNFVAQLLKAELTLSSKVKLSGDWGWKEIDGSPFCGIEGTVKLEFDPLLQLDVKIDITIGLLRAIGSAIPAVSPVCESIIKLKEAAELSKDEYEKMQKKVKDGTAPKFYAGGYLSGGIYLTIKGGVKFSASWTKGAGDSIWNGTTESENGAYIRFEISASLEGHGTAKAWSVSVSAGGTIKASAESGFTATNIDTADVDKHPALACRLIWDGITVSFLGKADGNVAWGTKESDDPPPTEAAAGYTTQDGNLETTEKVGGSLSDSQAKLGYEKSCKYTWFPPHIWNFTNETHTTSEWKETKDGKWVQEERVWPPRGPFIFTSNT